MTTYLFTHKPESWDWQAFDELVDSIQNGKTATQYWSTGTNLQPTEEDNFLLVRIGTKHHLATGLIGYGKCISKIKKNTDPEGRMNIINLAFTKLQETPLIDLKDLQTQYPLKHRWHPQNCTAISDEIWSDIQTKLNINLNSDQTSLTIKHDIDEIENDPLLSPTEKEQLINARIGQGKFKKNLINYWGECAVTGCQLQPLLIASHIKPWKFSSNTERLDTYNGLLLTPNLDKLFDLGYISFDDNGWILYADLITPEIRKTLGLSSEKFRINIQARHEIYLQYHRKMHGFEA